MKKQAYHHHFKMTAIFLLILTCFVFVAVAHARPTYGKKGLVVSASNLASEAGAKTLQAGGNAIDAAVTTYFVLAVTRPYYASLGGGGLTVVRFDNKIQTIDSREHAPSAARHDMFDGKGEEASTQGGLASGVPGNVKGFYELHKKFGKLSWKADLEAAVELARNGFLVTEELARLTKECLGDFNDSGRKYFSTQKAQGLNVGDRLKQPQLAQALELIQKNGADGFYKGPVAADIVKSVGKQHGILVAKDLENYKTRWLEPLHAKVFGADIYTMAPPSSGGAIILAELKLAERLNVGKETHYGQNEYHLLGEIMNRVFFDRQYLADPGFATISPEELYKDARIDKWADTIDRTKKTDFDSKPFEMEENAKSKADLFHRILRKLALHNFTHEEPQTRRAPANTEENEDVSPSKHIFDHHGKPLETDPRLGTRERESTTHLSVVDAQGNAVAATVTINGDYGSGVVTDQYGIVMNNEMDDFTTQPGKANMFGLVQGKANMIEPGKTPLSSMTPTIVERDGKLFMVVGAPGGPKIINAVFQTVYHSLNSDLNLDEIVQAPRVHNQYKPDELYFDRTMSPDTQAALETKGHKLKAANIARVYSIRVTKEGLYEGAFDSRGEGGASGF